MALECDAGLLQAQVPTNNRAQKANALAGVVAPRTCLATQLTPTIPSHKALCRTSRTSSAGRLPATVCRSCHSIPHTLPVPLYLASSSRTYRIYCTFHRPILRTRSYHKLLHRVLLRCLSILRRLSQRTLLGTTYEYPCLPRMPAG